MRMLLSMIILWMCSFSFLNTSPTLAIGIQSLAFSKTLIQQRIEKKVLTYHDKLSPRDQESLKIAAKKTYPFIEKRDFSIHKTKKNSIILIPTSSSFTLKDLAIIYSKHPASSLTTLTLDGTKLSAEDISQINRLLQGIPCTWNNHTKDLTFSNVTLLTINDIATSLKPWNYKVSIKSISIDARLPVTPKYYDKTTLLRDLHDALQRRKLLTKQTRFKIT